MLVTTPTEAIRANETALRMHARFAFMFKDGPDGHVVNAGSRSGTARATRGISVGEALDGGGTDAAEVALVAWASRPWKRHLPRLPGLGVEGIEGGGGARRPALPALVTEQPL